MRNLISFCHFIWLLGYSHIAGQDVQKICCGQLWSAGHMTLILLPLALSIFLIEAAKISSSKKNLQHPFNKS